MSKGIEVLVAKELLDIYRRRRDARAKGVLAYSQELFDDVVQLVAQLETLPSDEPCSLETIHPRDGGRVLVVRARGKELGRLRFSEAEQGDSGAG